MSLTDTSTETAAPEAPKLPAYVIETWSIDRPKAYERNARKHSQKQIDQLRSSFRKFGQVWPILVRADETVIAGHGRLLAAQQEAYSEIRVIVARDWTEDQCRAFGLLDNKVALNSEWDDALLGQELADLGELGVDLSTLGFDEKELAKFFDRRDEGLTDPDEVPDEPVAPVSRLGDLWILGRHRITCGDSTKPADVSRVLGDVKPHLMVTDPPYGVEYDASFRNGIKRQDGTTVGARAVGKVMNDDRADWREAWALFPGEVAYVWHAGIFAGTVADSLIASDFAIRSQIIWAKQQFAIGRGHYHWQHEPCWYAVRKGGTGHWLGDRKQTTVWEIDKPRRSETGHSTQKPVECMKRPIENNSSPGQAVYEPFSGSGTTIIACEMTGRSCHAIELSPAYVDVAVRRWEAFTGLKATLEGDGREFDAVAAERLAKNAA